jgi:hypothetical protein
MIPTMWSGSAARRRQRAPSSSSLVSGSVWSTRSCAFPLIRSLVLGVAPIGFPPIEGFLFADAGTAWGETALGTTTPVFSRPGGQDPLQRPFFTSIGAGARINVFGYIIVEVDYVNPLDRDRGWHWQFNFQPGF